jgi:hypothetical protein
MNDLITLHLKRTSHVPYSSNWTSDSPAVSDGPRTPGLYRTYCDLRLSRIDIKRWTSVPIDDELAAGALSFYLETDHPIHGLFDADLFLHDLVSGEPSFCSPMLVNALLGWSCVSRRPITAMSPRQKS